MFKKLKSLFTKYLAWRASNAQQFNLNRCLGYQGGFLGTAASVIGITSGLNSLFGGGSATSQSQSQYISPWFTSGGAATAASKLQGLVSGGPQSIYQDPAFQQSTQYGLQGLERSMAARGMTQSGGEQTAVADYLQSKGWDSYMNLMTAYGNLAGANMGQTNTTTYNPAAQQQGGWNAVAQGLGGLNNIYGGGFGGGNVDTSFTTGLGSAASMPDYSGEFWM